MASLRSLCILFICICGTDVSLTTAPSLSSISPSLISKLVAGDWMVTQNQHYSCIRLIADIYLHLDYETRDGQNATARVFVPSDSVVTENSTCNVNTQTGQLEKDEQSLQLKFKLHDNYWWLTVNFTKDSKFTGDETNETVIAYYVRLDYVNDDITFPNNTRPGRHYTVENHVDKTTGKGSLMLFKSDSTHCYRCNSEETNEVVPGFSILTENLKVEAFLPNRTTLMDEFICEKDQVTTTTASPTTTSPSPTPKSTAGNWTVYNDPRYTCIRLMSDIYLNLDYKTRDEQNATARVHVPKRSVVTENSTCNVNTQTGQLLNDEQSLQLKFVLRNSTWWLTVNFTKHPQLTRDETNQTVLAYYVRLDYVADAVSFPNISDPGHRYAIENIVDMTSGNGSLSLFKSDPTHCYRCNAEEKTEVAPGFSISTQNLKVEAFLPNRTAFMGERICVADQQNESSDLVPIITGAALAALVLFVLIAYLVGRARAKATTYETI